jgi:hypothetical protein
MKSNFKDSGVSMGYGRRTFRFSPATLCILLFPIFVGAQTIKPNPPAGFCIEGAECAPENAQSSTGIKWHPGHYMQVGRNQTEDQSQSLRFGYYDAIANNSAIAGVTVSYTLKMLEGDTKGSYAAGIAMVTAEINRLKSLAVPKRLFIRINDNSYSGAGDTAYFPAYLIAAGCVSKHSGENRYHFKRWDSVCMGHLIDTLTAYSFLDDDPYFEGLYLIRETSVESDYQTQSGSSFTAGRYDTQLRRLMLAARDIFPTSNVIMPANWFGSNNGELYAYGRSIGGVGAGSPDTCPHSAGSIAGSKGCGIWGDYAITGDSGFGGHDFRGEIPIIYSVEASELGVGAVGGAGFLPRELFDYCNDTLHCSHMMWQRQNFAGTTEQQWNVGILALISARPTFDHDECPSTYPACNRN